MHRYGEISAGPLAAFVQVLHLQLATTAAVQSQSDSPCSLTQLEEHAHARSRAAAATSPLFPHMKAI